MAWLRRGLIPSWAKDAGIGARTINARADTVHEKPAFRAAFQSRRCLIPTEGFFEWKAGAGKSKTPYFVERSDGEPMIFAGLWERWVDPEGEVVETCTIITTEAAEILRPLHDRMPVILEEANFNFWLSRANKDLDALRTLLKPFPSDRLTMHPVSTLVNSPRNEGPEVIARASEPVMQRTLFD